VSSRNCHFLKVSEYHKVKVLYSEAHVKRNSWDFSFSQWWRCGDLWRLVDVKVGTIFSDDHNVSVTRAAWIWRQYFPPKIWYSKVHAALHRKRPPLKRKICLYRNWSEISVVKTDAEWRQTFYWWSVRCIRLHDYILVYSLCSDLSFWNLCEKKRALWQIGKRFVRPPTIYVEITLTS
jgi:hypothetical protein